MKTIKESVSWEYFDKFEPIIDKYMPDRGEGDTLASQAVTAVNKLIYKWYNDGDVYDNTHKLKGWWNDLSSYANWLFKYVPTNKIKGILSYIAYAESESDYEDLLKDLADYVLDENILSQMETPKVGSIYDCSGPFKFEEIDEDEDYEYEEETFDDEDEE